VLSFLAISSNFCSHKNHYLLTKTMAKDVPEHLVAAGVNYISSTASFLSPSYEPSKIVQI